MNMRELMMIAEGPGLQGIKKHQAQGFQTKQSVVAYMMKQGFELLGAGEYGAVFDHPSFNGKYVLKIFSDPGYEYFLEYCRTQPNNSNLPKFYGKMMRLGEHGRMIRMERLYTLANPHDKDVSAALFMAYRVTGDDIDESEAEQIISTWDKRYQDLYRAAYEVIMIVPDGNNKNMDLFGNIMQRKNGTEFVITDPYAVEDFKM